MATVLRRLPAADCAPGGLSPSGYQGYRLDPYQLLVQTHWFGQRVDEWRAVAHHATQTSAVGAQASEEAECSTCPPAFQHGWVNQLDAVALLSPLICF